MTAVILTAGRGERLGALTRKKNKGMLQVGGKSILEKSLDMLENAGITKVMIVVGYRGGEIKRYFGLRRNSLRISYVQQEKPTGIVAALELCKPKIQGDFILLLGDEIFVKPRLKEMLNFFHSSEKHLLFGYVDGKSRKEVSQNYTFRKNRSHCYDFVEKPARPFNRRIGTGMCMLTKDFFRYTKGAATLAEALQRASQAGQSIAPFKIAAGYFNINRMEDFTRAQTSLKSNRI